MNEETKNLDVARGVATDSDRLPVVAWAQENLKDIFATGSKVAVIAAQRNDDSHYTFPLCDPADAQALIAELRAELAGLTEAARGKEIDYYRLQSECQSLQAQPQAAPAERGAPDETAMARALCNYHADLCGVNRDDQWNLYSEDFLNDVAVMLAADRRLTPAPATADSDVREVK